MTSQQPARKRARYQVPSIYSGTALTTRSFPSHPGSSVPIVRHSEDSLKAENRGLTQKEGTGQSRCQVIRIDVLPDDVLEIFDFYMIMILSFYGGKRETEAWQSLVHVCRRWRCLVFRSPRPLDMRLDCTSATPARDTLDVWPALPLGIVGGITVTPGVDNVIVALGQSNRVYQVQLEKVPFPELTNLQLFSHGEMVPVIPDSFLGGSAPRLQCFQLSGIPLSSPCCPVSKYFPLSP